MTWDLGGPVAGGQMVGNDHYMCVDTFRILSHVTRSPVLLRKEATGGHGLPQEGPLAPHLVI